MTPTRRQRLRLNLGPLPQEMVPSSTIEITPDGRGGWLVVAAYPAKQVCSTRSRSQQLTRVEGIDAGVSEVFTDTSGRRYGTGQYQSIAARAEPPVSKAAMAGRLARLVTLHEENRLASTDAS